MIIKRLSNGSCYDSKSLITYYNNYFKKTSNKNNIFQRTKFYELIS